MSKGENEGVDVCVLMHHACGIFSFVCVTHSRQRKLNTRRRAEGLLHSRGVAYAQSASKGAPSIPYEVESCVCVCVCKCKDVCVPVTQKRHDRNECQLEANCALFLYIPFVWRKKNSTPSTTKVNKGAP